MAQISVVTKGTTYITYQVTGLDTSYTETTRQITWYIKKNTDSTYEKIGTVDLQPGVSSSGTYKIYGLVPGATYIAMCVISNIQGSSDVALYSEVTRTNGSTPIITSFDVWQVSIGSTNMAWSFNFDNAYVDVTTYEVQARKVGTTTWYTKTEGMIEGSNVEIESFSVDNFGDYEFRLILDTNGYSDTEIVEVTVIPNSTSVLNPVITSILHTDTLERSLSFYWDCSEASEDVECDLYGKSSSSDTWELLGSQEWSWSGTRAIYWDLNNEIGDYDFYIQTTYNNITEKSDIVTCKLEKCDKISNFKVERIPKGFNLSWTPLEGVSSYIWSLIKPVEDGFSLLTDDQTTEISSITINDDTLKTLFEQGYSQFGEINYGITYRILIELDNDTRHTSTINSWNGDFSCDFTTWSHTIFEQYITSAPARPVISSATQVNGVITVSWGLEDASNISHVYFNLYDSSGNAVSGYGQDFQNTTSGTFSFPAVSEGQYQIRASSSFVVDGEGEIHSVNDDGSEYKLYYNITVGDAVKPELWQWTQEYGHSDNTTGTISATAYIPYSDNELHPVTAVEWNDFVARVNEVRAWAKEIGLTVSGDNLQTVSPGDDFATAYKAAVTAIKNISGWGGLLPTVFPVVLSSSLFIGSGSLQEELNAIIEYNG